MGIDIAYLDRLCESYNRIDQPDDERGIYISQQEFNSLAAEFEENFSLYETGALKNPKDCSAKYRGIKILIDDCASPKDNDYGKSDTAIGLQAY